MLKSNDVILFLGGALFGALYAAMVYFSLQGFNMSYTLKKPINGLSFDDIKRIYDNNPSMTLKELSNLTGYAVPFLKKLLLSQGFNMEHYKIVGYLLTYRYPEYSGLTHLDRFDTLAKAEEYAETSELTEYVINPIVDLSGD